MSAPTHALGDRDDAEREDALPGEGQQLERGSLRGAAGFEHPQSAIGRPSGDATMSGGNRRARVETLAATTPATAVE
jgi:hypothetical protein